MIMAKLRTMARPKKVNTIQIIQYLTDALVTGRSTADKGECPNDCPKHKCYRFSLSGCRGLTVRSFLGPGPAALIILAATVATTYRLKT